jgi:hypothetical protein
MQSLCMEYFGVGEFAARLPNALCGIATVWVLYRLGKRLYTPYFGLLWAMVFVCSFFPQLYFRSAVMEPWFNLFVFLGIYHLSRIIASKQEPGELYRAKDRTQWLLYSAFFTTLAVLIKGPLAVYIVYFTLLLTFVLSLAKNGIGFGNMIKWIIFILFFNGLWIGYNWWHEGSHYIKELLYYQFRLISAEDSDAVGPWYFHIIFLIIGCFPASAFVIQGFKNPTYEPVFQSTLRRMMVASLLVIVLIFTIVKVKVIHYSSFAYFPITFLATYNIYRIFKGEIKWTWVEYSILAFIGIFWCVILIGIPYSGAHLDAIKPFIQNPHLLEMLATDVKWFDFEIIFGVIFAIAFLLSFILFLFKKNIAAVMILFFSTGFMTQIMMIYFTPKIEKYTQGALVEFCISKKEEDCNINTYNMKSYSHLFYANDSSGISLDSVIYNNKVPVRCYVISNIQDTSTLNHYPNLLQIYSKNGYAFYVRDKGD